MTQTELAAKADKAAMRCAEMLTALQPSQCTIAARNIIRDNLHLTELYACVEALNECLKSTQFLSARNPHWEENNARLLAGVEALNALDLATRKGNE